MLLFFKKAALAFFCALSLSACAGVDQFSDRALSYNDQAEAIKEQQFLLNVMRAAYREPLQYSDFTQVTGQASVSGTAAFALPISTFPANLMRTYTASPAATISGNQSFTIVNLNTQDFYAGILAPIALKTIDYYMQAEFPKALVLTLFVQRIELRPVAAGRPTVFLNSYLGDDYRKFEAVLQAAIGLGLTTETVNTLQPIGPPMTAAQLPALRYLTALGTTGAQLKTYEVGGKPADPHLSKAQAALFAAQHVSEYYRLVESAPHVHFCFETDSAGGAMSGAAVQAANAVLVEAGVLRPGLTLDQIKIPPADVCGAAPQDAAAPADSEGAASHIVEFDVKDADAAVADRDYQIVITPRSVEGIEYYLGEWARAELGIDPAAQAGPPVVMTGRGADRLFMVGRDCPADSPAVRVSYHGGDYCLAIDPTGADRSAQVMEIVSQLFALDNSAKDLPSSNLISVLSP